MLHVTNATSMSVSRATDDDTLSVVALIAFLITTF